MRRVLTGLLLAGLIGSAYAAEQADVCAELDAKIAKSLESDKWHPASKVFVKALWEDYKAAYRTPEAKARGSGSIFSKNPDVTGYDDYVGSFRPQAGARGPSLTVSKDGQGRFTVGLEGHTIPAVVRNRIVLLTTGDVVYSPIPTLASAPYCTLEMYMLIRTDGRYYFGSPAHPPERWMALEKLKN
jgi:hypothetical protein